MAVSTIPSTGLTLHGFAQSDHSDKKQSTHSAVLLKLSDNLLDDVKKHSNAQGGLQFITGNTPVRRDVLTSSMYIVLRLG